MSIKISILTLHSAHPPFLISSSISSILLFCLPCHLSLSLSFLFIKNSTCSCDYLKISTKPKSRFLLLGSSAFKRDLILIMGSGDWIKKIVSLKKLKNGKPKYLKGSSVPQSAKGLNKNELFQMKSSKFSHHVPNGNPGIPVEDLAATRIQSAFRAYRARKTRRQLKGTVKLRAVALGSSSRKQASVTLKYLHTWSRLQTEIRTRRNSMAVEARIRQRKLENQLKLETKLHDLEVEWSNGPETMEEVLARIHLREEAAVKRERAMAYAFSHQWRANSNPALGSYELGKAIWGWSWMERWVAARPWESRALIQSSPKKSMSSKQASKTAKNMKSPTIKSINSVKSISPNEKVATKPRKLSFGAADQQANTKKESIIS